MSTRQKSIDQNGFVMPMVIGFILVSSIIVTVLITVIQLNIAVSNNNNKRQQAFNIAEAGINYYLWHLSHNSTDFKDGKNTPTTPDPNLGFGPYEHNYIDDNGKNTGTYTLWIKPHSEGSTIATVRSIGRVKGTDTIRTVEAQLGVPSFASYGVNSDSALWFGDTEVADGPTHSNVGIRMDGLSRSDVTSANESYIPSSQLGGNGSTRRDGVWCNPSITTPVNCNTRNKSDWRYPVSSVDFNQISGSLCTIKKIALGSHVSTASIANQSNACTQVPTTRTPGYVPRRASTFNASRGYLVQLNSNGTYDLFNVNGENDLNTPYTSALTLTTVASNIAIPSTGVVYVEDNVWVRTNPTFRGRVSIGAGRLESTNNANITIADDIVYSTRDGSDAIGLIAEGNVQIAPYAPPASGNFEFKVEAAIISQSGDVNYRLRYNSNTNRCTRGWVNNGQTFNYYGSVSTRLGWTWTWLMSSNCGDAAFSSGTGYISGIKNNTTSYDYNLLYNPPPSFPLTSTYDILSWREVLTKP